MNRAYFSADPIVFGGAINQGRPNVDYEIKRIKKKMEAGARYFMTQPVYSDRDIEVLDRMKKETGAKILCGIMPLISYKNAFFVKNEIAGIVVPDEVLAMYSPDMNREEGEEAGRQISKEVIKKAEPVVDGFYFMLPFNRINLLDGLVDKKKGMEL
jgi:homocysteine S-methyltransferase